MREKAPLWNDAEIKERILHHDGNLIVFNKPYDWPTSGHNLTDEDCVQFHLIRYLRECGLITPTAKHPQGMAWAIHQLDADTSGLVLFTTERKAVNDYHQLLTSPETEKTYLAIVSGQPSWNTITETTPLGIRPDGSRGPLTEAEGGQSTHTDFTVIERHGDFSVLKVRLHTGRTHQIRLHLAELGHSLLGEEWYSSPPCTRHFRQALHAYSLSLPDIPVAPIPDDLRSFISDTALS